MTARPESGTESLLIRTSNSWRCAILILTRRVGEGLMLGDDIHVVVTQINGGQVRLGIDAPRETRVLRDEVYTGLAEEEEKTH